MMVSVPNSILRYTFEHMTVSSVLLFTTKTISSTSLLAVCDGTSHTKMIVLVINNCNNVNYTGERRGGEKKKKKKKKKKKPNV